MKSNPDKVMYWAVMPQVYTTPQFWRLQFSYYTCVIDPHPPLLLLIMEKTKGQLSS